MHNSLYNESYGIDRRMGEGGDDRISQALQEAGIPFLIKSFLDTAYDGLYIPQKGWGIVMVSEKNKETAERLITEVKRTFKGEEEDETGQSG